MLVKKSDILAIDMVDIPLIGEDSLEREQPIESYNVTPIKENPLMEYPNNFCVRVHLKDGEQVLMNAFTVAGFDLDDPEWVWAKAKQLRLVQEYIDKHPDGSYVELSSSIVYGMDVYH